MPTAETAQLDRVAQRYGWPSPENILNPQGAGPSRHAQLIRQKIETSLCRRPDANRMRVGLLTRDPAADATEDPLAIVCSFPSGVSLDTLAEAHRLAWSFSRTRVLLIVERNLLRVWTCCEAPRKPSPKRPLPAEIASLPLYGALPPAAADVARSLEWVRFASGELLEAMPDRFLNKERADRTLLENLRVVRKALLRDEASRPGLPEDIVHDLLARIIFIQFLFHRKDSNGRPALGAHELDWLAAERVISGRYRSLGDILRNHDNAYRLFMWLDDRFNGDLFPGKDRGGDEADRQWTARAWKAEMRRVRPQHLALLGDLVDGRLQLKSKSGSAQLHLWPLYAFDAIPLDFISSIYEEFVGEGRGVHYTPHHLVDHVLDGVLPWNGTEWDLNILDPACGSGIFLVKAFQRLVHRWREAHPGKAPGADLLRGLLEKNLFGVDNNADAVRVASLSLYLAMCDEIDPRHYWTRVRLPCLRGRRLVHADFFEERPGVDTVSDGASHDLVVGNAPWGEDTVTPAAEAWCSDHGWHLPNRSIGPLFLVKGAALTRPDGFVSMLQPAGTLLYNRSRVACNLRRKLFETYEVEEVVDFSALRRDAFERSIAPVCSVVLQPKRPDDSTVLFARARRRAEGGSADAIIIEATNVHELEKHEAAHDPWVWSVLWHGTRRDLEFVHRLAKLRKIDSIGESRMGIVRGSDPTRRRHEPTILRRKILEQPAFPPSTFLILDADELEENEDPYVTAKDSKSLRAFAAPQMLIKMTWVSECRRFRAVIVDTHGAADGVLCSQSYVSMHADESGRGLLEAACLTLNSSLAVYFLTLTGSSFADYIPKALGEELRSVPLPGPWHGDLRALNSFADVDREVFGLFDLREADRILLDDFIGRLDPASKDVAPDMSSYGEQLVAALECFGVTGTCVVLQLVGDTHLPLRVVALYFRRSRGARVEVELVTDEALRGRLMDLDRRYLRSRLHGSGGILFHRVVRIYDVVVVDGVRVPAVYLVKPNRRDCWSKSAALRDADELIADAVISLPSIDGSEVASA